MLCPAKGRHRLTTRGRFGLLVHALRVVALVPAYLLLAPAADWSEPVLLGVLFALAVIADRHDVPLPSGIAFDATAAARR